jgi:hypothetical protein
MRLSLAISCGLLSALLTMAQTYDVVLSGGRVMDPASELNAIRNIGIQAGKILLFPNHTSLEE